MELNRIYNMDCLIGMKEIPSGSGTTAKACRNTNRNFIGFEKEADIWEIAVARLAI